MPDITMCSGSNCPIKEACWRHTAVPNEYRQAFFMNPPFDHEANDCEMFWKIEEDEGSRIRHRNYHTP